MKVIVEIPSAEDRRWKSWAKKLEKIDKGQQNGYAFVGPWLSRTKKVELPVGAYVLLWDEVGSRNNRGARAKVCEVTEEATLKTVLEAFGRSWALSLRDDAAKLFDAAESKYGALLGELPLEALEAEIKRRQEIPLEALQMELEKRKEKKI